MRIAFIGSGNVAWHFSRAMVMAGHEIIQVYSRQLAHASELAQCLNAQAIDRLEQLDQSVDLVVIAVKDDAIAQVAQTLRCTNALVVHTSGSTDMQELAPTSPNIGILYAPQTFRRQCQLDYEKLHFCLESNNETSYQKLELLVHSISPNCHQINSEQRRQLHLASVIVNNFGNALNAMAQQWLKQKDIPFNILQPLIEETAQKATHQDLWKQQTGPAARRDQSTIAKHLAMLDDQPEMQQLYQLMTQIIDHATH